MVARASESRRREFTTARGCARRALFEFGLGSVAILADQEHGAPIWPTGIVGSITHCAGYRAAVVARSDALSCIGIDAEPNENLPWRVLSRIASDQEREMVCDLLSSCPQIAWDRLLFSAKEAVYKAWHPLTQRWLGSRETSVIFDPVAGSFAARLLVPGPEMSGYCLAGFAGRWLFEEDRLITAIAVTRRSTVASR
jgi:4'-phosphopantetheinyl transferase EntD